MPKLLLHFVPGLLQSIVSSFPSLSCSGDVNLRFLAAFSGVMLAVAFRTGANMTTSVYVKKHQPCKNAEWPMVWDEKVFTRRRRAAISKRRRHHYMFGRIQFGGTPCQNGITGCHDLGIPCWTGSSWLGVTAVCHTGWEGVVACTMFGIWEGCHVEKQKRNFWSNFVFS